MLTAYSGSVRYTQLEPLVLRCCPEATQASVDSTQYYWRNTSREAVFMPVLLRKSLVRDGPLFLRMAGRPKQGLRSRQLTQKRAHLERDPAGERYGRHWKGKEEI